MNHLLLVALGGAFGSVCRYLAGNLSVRLFGLAFPWGTLAINVAGSFLIGVVAEAIARKFDASTELRLLLMTGVLGGFTTFSAFSLDAISLFERGAAFASAAYVVASVCLSLAAVFAGLALGRAMF